MYLWASKVTIYAPESPDIIGTKHTASIFSPNSVDARVWSNTDWLQMQKLFWYFTAY